MKVERILKKNPYIIVLTLAIVFYISWLQFFPDKVFAQTPWDKKAPPSVVSDVASGKSYDLIVLFDDASVQEEVALYRFNIGEIEDTPKILEIKKMRYEHLKQRVFSKLLEGEHELIKNYSHLPMSFVRIKTLSGLSQLLSQIEVLRGYPEEKYRHFLNSSLPFINQPQVAATGKTGSGTTVAVLDTGLNYNHSHFGNCTSSAPGFCSDTNPPPAPQGCKVVCVRDFTPSNDGFLDDNGHGTNVSGIVVGVAPDTRIAALDVFRTDGFAYSSDIIAAINWSIANKATYNIVAINMSLGGGGSTTPCSSDIFATPISNARSAGILSSIASGNEMFTNKISSPACVPAAVSVGAVYDGNIGGIYYSTCTDTTTAPDKVTCFSNSANFLTMLAPGANITAAGFTMFGTSQAAPHIAGAIAVLKGQNAFPSHTSDQIVNRMTSSGVLVTDSKNNITKPRIDLLAATSGGEACTYNITSTNQIFGTAGGNGSVNVTAGTGCSWTAVSNNAWITITGGNNGTGNGAVTYSVAPNDGNSRTGTITIAGKIFTVNQSGIGGNLSISGTVTRAGTPLPGVNISLTGNATVTTTTDVNGNYTFTNLANGTYTVTPSLSGFTFSPSNSTVSINNANVTGQNFTASALALTISGTITSGSSPLAGLTVTLTGVANRTATTNSSGIYIFAGLPTGNYTITPSLSGYTFTPISRAVSIIRSITRQNFTATPSAGTFSISGTVTITGGVDPLAGATITLSGTSVTTTTNASGVYTFSGLANGNYTVIPSSAGFTFSPTSRAVTINGLNQTGQDFTAVPVGGGAFSISGRIANIIGVPVANVTVILSGGTGRTTTTNANGEYSFTGTASGSYIVTPTMTGMTFTPAFRDVIINNGNATGINFTAVRAR